MMKYILTMLFFVKGLVSISQIPNDTLFPIFTKGASALNSFIGRNVKYPADAGDKMIGGTVLLKVTVDTLGIPADIQVIKEIYPSLDNEAVRILGLTNGLWTPGTVKNKKTVLSTTIGVIFKIK